MASTLGQGVLDVRRDDWSRLPVDDSGLGIAYSDLLVATGDLRRLIGRPTTALLEALRAALG